MTEGVEIWNGRSTPEIIDVAQSMFRLQGEERDRELFDWQYAGPLGGAYVALAHDQRGPLLGPVALYAAFPNRFLVHGIEVIGVQSFDTLTVAEFRGRGLFVELAKSLYTLMETTDIELVYGIPNALSVSGFSKHLGWKMIDPLPMRVRPIGLRFGRVRVGLRKPSLENRVGQSKSITMVLAIPPDISELFHSFVTDKYVGVIRDFEYLSWRLSRPGSTYRMFEKRSSSGTLLAFGVYELLLKHDCCLGYVMELMIAPGREHDGKVLLSEMISEMQCRGADLVFCLSIPGSNAYRGLRSNHFFNFSERIRPIELHCGFRPIGRKIIAANLARENWNFSYLDSDTV